MPYTYPRASQLFINSSQLLIRVRYWSARVGPSIASLGRRCPGEGAQCWDDRARPLPYFFFSY